MVIQINPIMRRRYVRLKAPVELNNLINGLQKRLALKGLALNKFKTQQFLVQINKNLILKQLKFEVKRKRRNPLDIKITWPL